MTFSETEWTRPSHAHVACLIPGNERRVKKTLQTLKNNDFTRPVLPKSGKKGYRKQCLLLFFVL